MGKHLLEGGCLSERGAYYVSTAIGRDVDNSQKPGKLPDYKRDFSGCDYYCDDYFFLQNVFKCCQKIVSYLFHLFTPSNLGIACQRHTRVGLWPKYLPVIARFPPVKNFSYILE